ncbi:hypothetical protein SPADD19_00557 [Streptococcus parasanguinis]|nr:hypothetical protein SPADD19_00557 [Streptococcus parasanguinis]
MYEVTYSFFKFFIFHLKSFNLFVASSNFFTIEIIKYNHIYLLKWKIIVADVHWI